MWQITPKASVGPLTLSSPIKELEFALGNNCDRFIRRGNPNEILAYDEKGIHIESGADGLPAAITIFQPCSVSLGPVELIGREVSIVERELREAGFAFARVDAGLWNEELLIMIVEQNNRVDSVEIRRIPY